MKPVKASIAVLVGASGVSHGQHLPEALPQSTAWNSSFKLTPEQIKLGQLTPDMASSVELVLNFERSQLAFGGPRHDSFYKLDNTTINRPPKGAGEVLKVQELTDPSVYNLPAQLALSRILYSTTNLNGTLIPASAAILWPYTAKQFGGQTKGATKDNSSCSTGSTSFPTKAPLVLWTHGTSGLYADGAPSAHRSLFYGDIVPFTLAQAGYVVVMPDYAGLGIDTSWDGSFVPHQYHAHLAGATDALNSVRAARTIWGPNITDDYVVIGHSQGGSVAWGVSELLASEKSKYSDLEEGHLGTVVFNPGTGTIYNSGAPLFFPAIGKYLAGVFPDFVLSDWLTPLGAARTQLLGELQGGQFVAEVLLANQSAADIVSPAWNETWYEAAATGLANPGGRPFKGPMVLFEGEKDANGGFVRNKGIFNATCGKYGDDFEFVGVLGAGHFPTMDASRQQWLQWIEDRFEGKQASSGCKMGELERFLPAERYQVQRTSFNQWTGAKQWFYQLPIV